MATKRAGSPRSRSGTRGAAPRGRAPKARARPAPKVRTFGAQDFRHRAFTLAEQVQELNRFMSLSRLSRETMIPRSTLRRYRDGGRPRGDVGELYGGIINSGFREIHTEIVREHAARRQLNAIGKPVRVKRRDPLDPSRRIDSDSSDRNILNSSPGAVVRAMRRGAERSRMLGLPGFVRFLVLASETDPEYPGQYFWTEPEALSDLEDEDISDVEGEARSRGTMVLMRIQDRG